jgi:hypothetical protein
MTALLAASSARTAEADEPVFEVLNVESTRLDLQFESGFNVQARKEISDWVSRSAHAVSRYLGKFPVGAVTMLIVPVDGNKVASGTTFNDDELRIRVRVGRNTMRSAYLSDWIMVHEMIHLAIPQVPRHQNWFHEGAATYVEIVARAQAGLSGDAGGWAELYRNLHQGLPQAGDRGLDRTPTWGRTYWGGALFCLMADVELRKRSGNRVGFQDAMRGLVAAGGNYAEEWPLEKTLATADAATGFTVLTDLHTRMKDRALPSDMELAKLWAELGVTEKDGVMIWSDAASLAEIRRAIVASLPRKKGR